MTEKTVVNKRSEVIRGLTLQLQAERNKPAEELLRNLLWSFNVDTDGIKQKTKAHDDTPASGSTDVDKQADAAADRDFMLPVSSLG